MAYRSIGQTGSTYVLMFYTRWEKTLKDRSLNVLNLHDLSEVEENQNFYHAKTFPATDGKAFSFEPSAPLEQTGQVGR